MGLDWAVPDEGQSWCGDGDGGWAMMKPKGEKDEEKITLVPNRGGVRTTAHTCPGSTGVECQGLYTVTLSTVHVPYFGRYSTPAQPRSPRSQLCPLSCQPFTSDRLPSIVECSLVPAD